MIAGMEEKVYGFKWTARKIASKDFWYVPRRLSYIIRRRYTQSFFDFWADAGALKENYNSDPECLLAHLTSRKHPTFHFGNIELPLIAANVPQQQQDLTISEAHNLLMNRFTFRSRTARVDSSCDWEYAPDASLAWRWDRNRMFWFSTLGRAYWYTGDDRFAECFTRQSESWSKACADRLAELSWDHPFEVAARINGWIWGYFLFRAHPKWDALAQLRFLKTLGRLAEYLYWTIEYHNPGNHVLLEAKALAVCAEMFPEFEGAARWAQKAWRIVERELDAQICEDGVHEERSTMYHRIVAGELSELLLICLRNQLLPTERLFKVVAQMAAFEEVITVGSKYPLFGDAYETDVYIRFVAPEIVRSCLRGSVCGRPSETTLFVTHDLPTLPVGCSGVEPERRSKGFAAAGYFVSRSSTSETASTLVWDCGPVGYKMNRNHAHLDALSFWLAVEGVPMLIDPGTNETDEVLRRVLRGTGAHNTVRIDGRDQSILAKRNDVWDPAVCECLLWASQPECDFMIGRVRGSHKASNPSIHTRTIVSMHGRYWFILDDIDGMNCHRAEQRFHFAPGTVIRRHDQATIMALNGTSAMTLMAVPVRPNTFGAGNNSSGIELSTEESIAEMRCGSRSTIQVVTQVCAGRPPYSCGVLLTANAQQIPTICTRVTSKGIREVRINGYGYSDHIMVPERPDLLWQTGRLRSDARLAVYRDGAGSSRHVLLLGGVSVVTRADTELLTKSRQSSLFRIDGEPDSFIATAPIEEVSLR